MFRPVLGRWIGYCAAVCVLALFFFPLAFGPFQATHGPTTAFRARQNALAIIYSMYAALIHVVCALATIAAGWMAVIALGVAPIWPLNAPCAAASPNLAVLRC